MSQVLHLPVADERMWRSIQVALDTEFKNFGCPADMRKHVSSEARAVFERWCLPAGPIKIAITDSQEGGEDIATWLNGFADHFRFVIISLVAEIAEREVRIFAFESLSLPELQSTPKGDLP